MVRADRDLFARLLIVAQNRALDIKDVLRYEIGPMPWSLASVDGSLVKTNKAKLMECMEKNTLPVEQIPPNAAVIIDAMAILQSITSPPTTSRDLAIMIFDKITAHKVMTR